MWLHKHIRLLFQVVQTLAATVTAGSSSDVGGGALNESV